MAAPKLKTTAVPTGPQRVLRSSAPVPTSRLKLKGSDGKVIQPKAPVPAPETPEVPVDPEAEARAQAEAAAAAAAAEEEARKAQEEYDRQMEEYNRQMEEYNRQMEAIKAEEEARRRAEEEARRAEEEARAKAEAEARAKAEAEAKVLAEIEAKLRAEEEAKRRAEEEARAKAEEERRLKEELEAQLRAEAEANLLADKDAKLKAAALARAEEQKAEAAVKSHEDALLVLSNRIAAETDAQAKAALEAEYQQAEAAKAAAVQAAEAAKATSAKAGAEALAAARAAAAVAPKPAPTPAPAPAPAPKPGLSKAAVPKTAMKVSGLSPATPKVAGLTPAAPKAAEVPKTSMPKPAGLTPSTPKLGVPKTSLPKAGVPKTALRPAGAPAPAAAEASAEAAAPAPAPSPALKAAVPKTSMPKLGAKRPAASAATPALGKPRVSAAPVPAPAPAEEGDAPVADGEEYAEPIEGQEAAPAEPTEAEIARREEEIAALQAIASKPPFWKTPGFLMGAGFLLAISGICGYMLIADSQEKARQKAYFDKVQPLLLKGQDINKNRVEKLADAKAKNLNVSCSKEDAKVLLDIVANPYTKKDDGTYILGPRDKCADVALNACILLCIAAEQDEEICKMVFDVLTNECNAKDFEFKIYNFMVSHLANTEIKGINKKLKALVKEVGKKTTIKGTEVKWSKKAKFAASTWQAIGLRVSDKDLPEIIEVLKDESLEAEVVKNMQVVVDNIFQYDTKDAAKRSKLGDQLFEAMPEKRRTDRSLVRVYGRSGSAKALEYFKARSADPKNWDLDCIFYSSYTGSNIVPYLLELKAKAGGDAKKEKLIDGAIGGILGQNRDRKDAEVEELISLVFGDRLTADTTDARRLSALTDTDGVDFEPDAAKRAEYKKQLDALSVARNDKRRFINTLADLHDHGWVVKQLKKMAQDKDQDIAIEAKNALEKVKVNRMNDAANQTKFNAKKQTE